MKVSFSAVNNSGFIYNNKHKTEKNSFVNQPFENIQKNNTETYPTNDFLNINFKARTYCKYIKTITQKDYQKFLEKICNSTEPQNFQIFVDTNQQSGAAFQSFIVWLYNNHQDLIKNNMSILDLSYILNQLNINSKDDENTKLLKILNANVKAYFIDFISKPKNHKIKEILTSCDDYMRMQGEDFSFTDILTNINPYNVSEKIGFLNKAKQNFDFLYNDKYHFALKDVLADKGLALNFEAALDSAAIERNKEAEDNCNVNSLLSSKINEQSDNKDIAEPETNITFADIGGQDKAIQQLKRSIVYPVKYREDFAKYKYFAKYLKNNERGIILYGPPGTGKSLIANALKNEAGCFYKAISGSEMENRYVGETEAEWRKLFNELEQNQPAILFIDEADGLCKKRGGIDEFGAKELNEFLKLTSDARLRKLDIYIVLATNNIEAFDSAVRRPGRFGIEIEMLPPQSVEDVKNIFNIHTKDTKLADEVTQNIDKICEKMFEKKLTGADIEFVVDKAQTESMERLKIYEKLDNGSIADFDMESLAISLEDITKAIDQSKKTARKRVSFGE